MNNSLTSAVGSNIGLRTKTLARWVADRVTRAVIVNGTPQERHALGLGIRFRDGAIRALAFVRAVQVDANGANTTQPRLLALVDILTKNLRDAISTRKKNTHRKPEP